ncbi:MAG: repair protein RecO [Francisellaceae bacterium]|nr:repair protein RecO [Francisellaceae bacterium]
MMQFNLEAAYVLHTRLFQETSLIIEVLSREYGRLSLIAKGANRPKSLYKGILQAFLPLWISGGGKNELLNLRHAELRTHPLEINGRLLVCGFYINELLIRLLARNDPHPELFDYYEFTLKQLILETNTEISLRLFEKTLLESIGYKLQLNKESNTQTPIQEEVWYLYDAEEGAIPVRQSKFENKALTFKGKSLLALHTGLLNDEAVLQDAKKLMRQVLKQHLGSKPLESRRLLC